jgi:hypothetical protein
MLINLIIQVARMKMNHQFLQVRVKKSMIPQNNKMIKVLVMNPVIPLKKIYINKTLMETGKMLIDFKIILEMRTD